MQAIELIVRRTKGSVSHAASAPHMNLKHTPRFMVRVCGRSALQASIERTSTGMPHLAFISFWAKCVLPVPAAHVKR